MAAEVETKPDENTNTTATTEDKKVEETNEKETVKEEKKEDGKKEEKETKKATLKKDPAPPKPTVHKADYEKDRVYLYQFTRTPLLPSLSPFCLKVETWLRVTKLDYENVDHKMKFRSKQGLLPFVELNGAEINDSANIIKELGKRFEQDLDKDLTPEQRTLSFTTCSMIENHLFFVLYWWRSKFPGRFLKGAQFDVQQALGSKIPKPILDFIFKLRFRQGQKKVKAQGLGVHTQEEIEEFGRSDLQVLSDLLGTKDYFFGKSDPTLLDLTAFSVLAQFVYFDDKDSPFSLHSWLEENCKNLKDFVERIKNRFYPDWEEMCKNLDLNSHRPKPPPPVVEEKKEEPEKKEEAKEEKKDEAKEEPKKEEEKKSE